jgi:hypothetical protein
VRHNVVLEFVCISGQAISRVLTEAEAKTTKRKHSPGLIPAPVEASAHETNEYDMSLFSDYLPFTSGSSRSVANQVLH